MIRIASYNIRKAIGTDRLRRPERVLSVIDEIRPDIIALQEADRRFGNRKSAIPAEMLADHGDFRFVPVKSNKAGIGWHGNAILVRPHIKIIDQAVIEIPALEPRGAIVADLRVPGGDLRVVGMHLDLSGLWRRKQVRAILETVAERPKMPTVLMGDLNEWAHHRGCLVEFLHDYRIAFTGPSYHSQRPVARLDRIMVGENLRILGSGTHNSARAKRASDHLPVWAELAF